VLSVPLETPFRTAAKSIHSAPTSSPRIHLFCLPSNCSCRCPSVATTPCPKNYTIKNCYISRISVYPKIFKISEAMYTLYT